MNLKNEPVEIRKSIFLPGQLGVFSRNDFKKNHVVFSIRGPILSRPTKYSFSLDLNRHIDPVKENGDFDIGHYLNHSCDPNTFMRIIDDNEYSRIDVIARQDIDVNKELTFDYASLEYDTVTQEACRCGALECRKAIHGFKYLPKNVFEKYKAEGMIPNYLLQMKRD